MPLEHTPAVVASEAVRAALSDGRPVVALETAVLSHGLPKPHNLDAMAAMVQAVAEGSAVPAVVGVVAGQIRVGLDAAEWEALAQPGVLKCSLRDLPMARATGASGGTTVASTLWAARSVGIEVFATGGIGGVHPGDAWDVSADLPALARFGGAVVCSGAKSLLDLPKTLEFLETLSVPVVGYGTDTLPAFTAGIANLTVPHRVDGPAAAAAVVRAARELGLSQSVLIAVPGPDGTALDPQRHQDAVETATAEAAVREITGSATTPFILGRVAELTGGSAITANLALLVNNARVAAEIASRL